MKSINKYIYEKLKITKKRNIEYHYFPKTETELHDIIKEHFNNHIYNLNDIDTSKINSFRDLFNCDIYNDLYPENKEFDVSYWDVSNVKYMDDMFRGCKKFNCDLSNWNTKNLTTAISMFMKCNNFEGNGLENWNVNNLQYMNYMFFSCNKFNANLSNWNTESLISLANTFDGCFKFEGNGLENWDISNVKSIAYCFRYCKKFDADIVEWNIKHIIDMTYAFDSCEKFSYNLNSWNVDTDNVNTKGMFDYCDTLRQKNILPKWYK